MTTETEAWVLHRWNGKREDGAPPPAELSLETVTLRDMGPQDVRVEPLYGCWEANMTHALERDPVDICAQRGEERVVLGNAGIVRVLETGAEVRSVEVGDVCFFVCAGKTDEHGYIQLVAAYDMPGSVGVLARQQVLPESNLLKVPAGTRYELRQWATYARYWTAWDNWRVASACWRSQVSEANRPDPLIFGWGGGVAVAELELARRAGFRTAMTASSPERLEMLAGLGIGAVDRSGFPDLTYDSKRYRSDQDYRKRYQDSERAFLETIAELSDGRGVAIFIDNIGAPVLRATLTALGREGVLTTAGWKHGMRTSSFRAVECINRHIHVHTHACQVPEIPRAVNYQEKTGWLPELGDDKIYSWDEIPILAREYAAGTLSSYFPIFQVNPE
jgi:NADPH:quinone reductase-like Zn-dependent oxidoreductase